MSCNLCEGGQFDDSDGRRRMTLLTFLDHAVIAVRASDLVHAGAGGVVDCIVGDGHGVTGGGSCKSSCNESEQDGGGADELHG